MNTKRGCTDRESRENHQPVVEWFPGLQERQVGDVRIWWASLDLSASLVRRMEACLEEEEKKRAQCLIRWRDRERFILSRGLLRHLLSSLTGEAAASLRFQYGSHGKPMLRGADWEFNLSHSHDWVMVAVSPFFPVGIDVERIRPDLEVDKLAEMVMSDSEKREWEQLSEEARVIAFFRLWTRKEAIVKALGEGLSRPLPSLTVRWKPDRINCVDGEGRELEVNSLHFVPGYESALCIMK